MTTGFIKYTIDPVKTEEDEYTELCLIQYDHTKDFNHYFVNNVLSTLSQLDFVFHAYYYDDAITIHHEDIFTSDSIELLKLAIAPYGELMRSKITSKFQIEIYSTKRAAKHFQEAVSLPRQHVRPCPKRLGYKALSTPEVSDVVRGSYNKHRNPKYLYREVIFKDDDQEDIPLLLELRPRPVGGYLINNVSYKTR